MKRLLLLSLLLPFAMLQAQTRIVGDVAATQMVERHVELNQRVKTIPGYRVQIASFSGANSKTSAVNLRENFITDYPSVQAYIVFRTRLEAYAVLQQINDVYKGYIIRDNIYPEPPLLDEFAPDDESSGDE